MHSLVPKFILDHVRQQHNSGHFAAVVLFVDTSGFTSLTARLMEHGKEGAEALADILLAVFAPLVESIYAHGGFVAGFAGDAFTAVFVTGETTSQRSPNPRNLSESHRENQEKNSAFQQPAEIMLDDDPEVRNSHLAALTAAHEICAFMAAHPQQTTPFGDFDFAVRVSIADGDVTWGVWSVESHEIVYEAHAQTHAYAFTGEAIRKAVQGENYASPGELIITQAVHETLAKLDPELYLAEPLQGAADGYLHVLSVSGLLPKSQVIIPTPETVDDMALARCFYPPDLLTMRTRGEFRSVYTLFLTVESLPAPDSNDPFFATFFHLLHQYRGYLCRVGRFGSKAEGSTFLIFWGAPTSYENDLARALNFVLELRAQTDRPIHGGITHAVAFAGFVGSPLRAEYTCHGTSVNLASRQMSAAKWGQILVDAETARRAQDEFEVRLAGHYEFKGVADPQPVFEFVGRKNLAVGTAHETNLIGRKIELSQLQRAIEPIFAGRFGGLTLVSGEAGIGKSRLVHELEKRIGEQIERIHEEAPSASNLYDSPFVFVCQTDEILRESLNPFRYFLQRYFGQLPTANEATNKAKFTIKLNGLIATISDDAVRNELERTRSILGAFVNLYWPNSLYEQLDPQLRFENTMAALKTLILAESLRQPVLILLEDAQWLDADSRSFLSLLTRNVDAYPLAIVATTRPPEKGATSSIPAQIVRHEIPLTSLSAAEIAELAHEHLGGTASSTLIALLMKRAEGNPFFAEQLLIYLQEQALLENEQEEWRLVDHVKSETVLPDDVQTILVARIDRLTQMVRQVVQTAAVLGREFDVQVLSQILRGETDVIQMVKSAESAAIWSALSELRYLFKHALLRDAAYEMQLQTQRRQLHLAASKAMEQLYTTDLAPHYADLVYHYHCAGHETQELDYADKAARQAIDRFNNEEAVTYLNRVLTLVSKNDVARRFEAHLLREHAYDFLGKRTEQAADLTELQRLAEQTSESGVRLDRLIKIGLHQSEYAHYTQ
ncbi:AAA family ATPase [Chloroflexi bacterium TSY]|nr:AAA family ATPase [Chloroflexi bacterium TSY]